ncbi:uncharacterized protein LOC125316703 [Rhodamnia argentea]|uniref:Uncharacterized protein LOC125316703 n=1 Tax=Rhodamnia argentea TaxID=178133 RepID=A0ABM3HYM4_9MYRT|nr:uncharacterized protein LOC125316703 [Rhodamnia argentea]
MTVWASDFQRWEGNQNNVSTPYKGLHNMMAEGFNLSYGEETFPFSAYFSFCFLGFRYGGKGCDYYNGYKLVLGITTYVALKTIANILFIFAHFIAVKFILGAPFVDVSNL